MSSLDSQLPSPESMEEIFLITLLVEFLPIFLPISTAYREAGVSQGYIEGPPERPPTRRTSRQYGTEGLKGESQLVRHWAPTSS